MPDGGQFYLEPRFHTGGVLIEDLQYQIHPIPDIDAEGAQFLLDVENLPRFEDISYYQRVCTQSLHFGDDFLQFSFSHVGPVIGFLSFLVFLENDDTAISID